MARLWVVYREGLRLLGHVVAQVPLEPTVSRIDIAPWRLFATAAPDEVPATQVRAYTGRKRVLLEVLPEDRGDFCALLPGFYDSPFSPDEVSRRIALEA